jgi:AAA domain
MALFGRGRSAEPRQSNTVTGTLVQRGGLTPVAEWPEAFTFPAPGGAASRKRDNAPSSGAFAGICRYFHDCFAADSRGGVLTNVLDKHQAEYLTFADSMEVLLTGQVDRLEVNLSTGVTAQNAADVNRREKFLIYGSVFIVGRGGAVGKRKGELYCAPLLYWPARIEQEGTQAFMVVDLEEQRINFPLLASLIDAENDEQAQAYAEVILNQVPTAPFDNTSLREFASVVSELIPELRTDDLEAFPHLQDQAAIEQLLESPVQLLCASAMALVRRPTEARGVLTELQEMANRGTMSTPLSAIFGDGAVPAVEASGGRALPVREPEHRPILAGAELSAAQTRVLRRAEHRPLTLVIGPPGTGKSFTIAQLILDAVARGQTVMLSSKMNKAVDVVVEKLTPYLGGLTIILRGGDRRYRDEMKSFLDGLFDGTLAPQKPRPGEIEMLEGQLADADVALAQLEEDIIHLLAAERSWSQTHAKLAHFHGLMEPTGVDVEQLQRDYEELKRLENVRMPFASWMAGRKHRQLADEIAGRLSIPASRLPDVPRVIEREGVRADLANLESELDGYDELNALLTQLARKRAQRNQYVSEVLATRRRDALAEALRINRRTLALFKTALEARSTAEQDRIFDELDFEALLRTFPIWAVTNPHAAELLPLDREMFDLVVIDEASQCDVASALPLLYRGKRAIVCGDPKQLRHLSFLREDRQAALASQHGLSASQRSQWNYRTHSLLDVVNGALPSQDDVVLLDEHYRSLPQIIEFSNDRFYGGALRVMTRRPDTIGVRSLELRRVNGKRRKEGYNVEEADAVINEINRIARAEAKREPRDKSSIGVLSPFRDQVNYLQRALAAKLKSRVVQDHQVAVGTAHTFQGDERDIMLVSFCADPTSHRSSLTFMNNENLFNVAVTRARRRQVIFTGLDPRLLPPNHLLTDYLNYAAECLEAESPDAITGTATGYECEVAEALRVRDDYLVYVGYPVAGFTVDVVAQHGTQALAIACDGDLERQPPLPSLPSLDLPAGQAILERAGWRVHRIPYRRWRADREGCLAEIDALLGGGSSSAEEEIMRGA